ncbi:type A von willebrand factor domain protein (macronuclear) [Tetrahymena thermophila SB210]|uniref:Type A von willebrand factor domain protein n=1 Tax=Tetrahymena thermophila (strain SB210) TaxID=312017 RepID=Q233P0_TETTS|nr:type A von willebrand factor domain protein [Tetrahymena thermophila SB210]EAR91789.1 type A von willebrand factor domain protein [Tetrahymena thermophila SB210]|eukprot:XP_001012034.1 type A von willebrand factor domain protein [Tetrahymena thermophila SB210]
MNNKLKLRSFDFQLATDGSQKSSKVPATLKSVQYKCQIINNIMKTALTQTFVSNSDNEYSETNYYFPIQEGTCLESFEAKFNEKTIKGIIKEKSEAKIEYQENKQQGNFVSYAETSTEKDQDYCKILLGNLPPNQKVQINLVFSQQISCILNKYFIAQIPLQYCEDEVSAKLGINVLTLDLFCTGKITYAESRGYPAQKKVIDDNTVKFDLSQALLQKDLGFQLVFAFEGMFEPQVIFGSSKIYHEDSVKRAVLPVSSSVMVSLIPNFNEEVTKELDDVIRAAIHKGDDVFSDEFQQKMNSEVIDHLNSSRSEFIFLLDRSGSMIGQPIQKACEALILFLKSLPTDSYFNVVSFGSSYEKLFQSSIKYDTRSLEKAINQIKEYTANLLGTEIYKPLQNIFKETKIDGYNKQIFLLTDGEVESPKKVVQLIRKNNKFNRINSIGFGSGADKYLIEESAIAGKGISKIVDLQCDLSEIIIEMLSLCITPTLDQFQINYDKNIFESTYPSMTNFPCVFKDEVLNIHFFFKPTLDRSSLTESQKQISIEYFDSRKKQKIQKQIQLEMQDSFNCNPELQQSVFKIGKQLFLNENIIQEDCSSSLIQQSIDYQLLTEKTALICVIETLNDEKKIMYENISHSKQYTNQKDVLEEIFTQVNYLASNSLICVEDLNTQMDTLQNCKKGSSSSLKSTTSSIFTKIKNFFTFSKKSSQCPTSSNLCFDDKMNYIESQKSCLKLQGNCQINELKENLQKDYNQINAHELEQDKCDENDFDEDFKNKLPKREYQLLKEKESYLSIPKIENLLNLVNSEGVWKFDEGLIKQYCQKNMETIKKYSSKFKSQDAFMTLLIVILLETYYAQQKSKWMLISKKSNNFLKSQINQSEDLIQIKESIRQLISK